MTPKRLRTPVSADPGMRVSHRGGTDGVAFTEKIFFIQKFHDIAVILVSNIDIRRVPNLCFIPKYERLSSKI
jgi:hypothetical protein